MINKFLCLLLLINIGCGTDTGNPGHDPNVAHGDNNNATIIEDIPGEKVIPTLTDNICEKLRVCHDDELPDCSESLFETSNIDEEIGLAKDEYKNLDEVHKAFTKEELSEEPVAFDTCLTDIEELDCESDVMKDSLKERERHSYEGVAKIIPKSCKKINKRPERP